MRGLQYGPKLQMNDVQGARYVAFQYIQNDRLKFSLVNTGACPPPKYLFPMIDSVADKPEKLQSQIGNDAADQSSYLLLAWKKQR
jgi:hypothetical protein